MSFNVTIDRLQIELTRIFQETPEYIEKFNNAPLITWSWIATRTAQLMITYPIGLTNAIILAELESQWEQRCITMTSDKFDTIANKYDPDSCHEVLLLDGRITQLEYKHNTIWLATLKDDSNRELDLYLPLKFNDWINNNITAPHQFITKDRKIRLRCPPQINSVLTRHYHNMTLPRSDRVICCPPTHDCIWQLQANDEPWIRAIFFNQDTFATVIQPQSMANHTSKTHRLWLKVIHVEQDEIQLEDEPTEPGSRNKSFHNTINGHAQQQRLIRKDVYVVDKSNDTEPALLSFYDQQTDLTRMIQRGDYLGLYDPVIASHLTASQLSQTDLVFEYGPNTILFIMTNDDAVKAGVTKVDPSSLQSPSILSNLTVATSQEQETSQNSGGNGGGGRHSPMRDFFAQQKQQHQHQQQQQQRPSSTKPPLMERDDEGLMDCLTYAPRIKINDLEPSMLNITLSGRVIAKANNNPFLSDGKRMDRYAMRIEDESGKVDVTLWEQAGQYAKKVLVGQHILLTGLSTSVQHKSVKGKTTWYVNGSAVCGTVIYNVSHLDCLLVSNGFGQMTPLHSIQGDGQWETEATIVGWTLRSMATNHQPVVYSSDTLADHDDDFCLSDYMVVQAHQECSEIVQNDSRCSYCDVPIGYGDKYWMYRQRKQVLASSETTKIGWIEWCLDNGQGILNAYGGEEVILGYQAKQFKAMSPGSQIRVLDSAVGKHWACSISCVGSRGYRLDRLVLARQYQNRCVSLLNSIS
ncbi:hypothetical protein BCR42DRAFT_420592 [Absidia repens]|uniref:Uncharacterized protein n=1 Tax=Absidia repens TaxID=90262 RepID=A0A1X2I9Z1_9FUNG|nr:hypothetical protein BCR42DRAFT_420592 [Absidia repens]